MSEQLKISSTLGGIDMDHDYRVSIPFAQVDYTGRMIAINQWNETCATALEMFGLPGEKYTCRMTRTAIEFWFKDEKDAMMFELTCG